MGYSMAMGSVSVRSVQHVQLLTPSSLILVAVLHKQHVGEMSSATMMPHPVLTIIAPIASTVCLCSSKQAELVAYYQLCQRSCLHTVTTIHKAA